MNLKKSLLMILLLTALIPILSAQTLSENKKNLENDLGIDLTKTYSGTEVQTIIDIILEEADKSIDKAYKEGYKQATVELQPEIDYWMHLYNTNKNSKKYIKYSLISFGSGFIIGGYCGIKLKL